MIRKPVSMIVLSLLVICMLALAFRIQPARSSPATITVPDDYSTIQAAVDHASPYDTIIVRAGSYPENVTVNKNNLVIMGQHSHTAVVHGWFYLDTVSNTSIANFTIQGSAREEWKQGISFQQSSFNTIRNNVISNWSSGLYFNYMNYTMNPPLDPTTCHNNTITENDISDDCGRAILFSEGMTNNRFYHNNFYTTSIDYVITFNEFWDNGYPSGGNYWNGTSLVDEKCGPNQDQPGQDGINDTAYVVNSGTAPGQVVNVDHYPLVSPWSPPEPARTPGDLNRDGVVDGSDIALAAWSFGSYGPNCLYPGSPSHLRWNLDCDINGDGVIDGSDLILIARNFGEGSS